MGVMGTQVGEISSSWKAQERLLQETALKLIAEAWRNWGVGRSPSGARALARKAGGGAPSGQSTAGGAVGDTHAPALPWTRTHLDDTSASYTWVAWAPSPARPCAPCPASSRMSITGTACFLFRGTGFCMKGTCNKCCLLPPIHSTEAYRAPPGAVPVSGIQKETRRSVLSVGH